WLKILHNIMAIVDPAKLETATYGAWRSVLCRCCSYLVNNNSGINCSSLVLFAMESQSDRFDSPFHTFVCLAIATFSLAAQAILRLSLLPGMATPRLPSLVTVAMNGLKRLENDLEYPQMSMSM